MIDLAEQNNPISVAEQLWRLWTRRLEKYWSPYFREANLRLSGTSQGAFFEALDKQIRVDRAIPGLEEFAHSGKRGICGGDPARSLFYHVLASPHFTRDGIPDDGYPSFTELGIIENYIYSRANLTIGALKKLVSNRRIGIVVCAYEYAPAKDTVHGHHADLCFSRTGIARIGTDGPHRVPQARGFFPASGDRKKVHVVPARYGAFLAYGLPADPATFGPLDARHGDQDRRFWVPFHKLFNGDQCIHGANLQLEFKCHHLNQKIKRVHAALHAEGFDTGWTPPDLQSHPFVIEDGLAEFCENSGLVTPVPHSPMIQPARTKAGKLVGFPVPAGHDALGPILWFKENATARSSPEFVNVKNAIATDCLGREEIKYLPDLFKENIVDIVARGGYRAANLMDWTGDGWLSVSCPSLSSLVEKNLAAYSVLSQPDFFPLIKQQDLATWWKERVPAKLKPLIWPDRLIVPTALAETRYPANFNIPGDIFMSTDRTITAIVGSDRSPDRQGVVIDTTPRRESTLSYRATNLFDPGWDTSLDFGHDEHSKNGTFFLSQYGLGSPFAEDTLICSSFGGYWPGAVPDTTRFFVPYTYPSSTPIPDAESAWVGFALPKAEDGTVVYGDLVYADFTTAIMNGSLPYEDFSEVGFNNYVDRTQAMALVFDTLGFRTPAERTKLAVLSFGIASDEEFQVLTAKGWSSPQCRTYRFDLATYKGKPKPTAPRKETIELAKRILLFASPSEIALPVRGTQGEWDVRRM